MKSLKKVMIVLCVTVMVALLGCAPSSADKSEQDKRGEQFLRDAHQKMSAEILELKAQLKEQKILANDRAAEEEKKERKQAAEDAAKKVAEDVVKKTISKSLEMQAIIEAAKATGGSSVQLPASGIKMRTGEAATAYEAGEADRKRCESQLAVENVRLTETKAQLEAAQQREAELKESISELRAKIKETEKALLLARTQPRAVSIYPPGFPNTKEIERREEINRNSEFISVMKAEMSKMTVELRGVSANVSQLTQAMANKTTVTKRYWDPDNCKWVEINIAK